MSYRIRAVARAPLAAGLRLAGVPADEVPSADAAAERVGTLASDPELGILLVEQPLYDAFAAPLRHELETRALPIVVPVPPPRWGAPSGRAEGYILELLRRAIGYRVRLQ